MTNVINGRWDKCVNKYRYQHLKGILKSCNLNENKLKKYFDLFCSYFLVFLYAQELSMKIYVMSKCL